MTLKEIKEYIERYNECGDINTNIGHISLIREGTMNPYFKFHVQEKTKPEYKFSLKNFYDMLINQRDIIEKAVTNIVSLKAISANEKVINDSNNINLIVDLIVMFEISENSDDKTLTGSELIATISEWPESFMSIYKTNIEDIYFLTDGTLTPKLFINRPDLHK